MTLEELNKFIEDAAKQFERQRFSLVKQYLDERNTVKIGDIVTDHIGSVMVNKIWYAPDYSSHKHQCAYEGTELTKKLEPNKKGKIRRVYQRNMITA